MDTFIKSPKLRDGWPCPAPLLCAREDCILTAPWHPAVCSGHQKQPCCKEVFTRHKNIKKMGKREKTNSSLLAVTAGKV